MSGLHHSSRHTTDVPAHVELTHLGNDLAHPIQTLRGHQMQVHETPQVERAHAQLWPPDCPPVLYVKFMSMTQLTLAAQARLQVTRPGARPPGRASVLPQRETAEPRNGLGWTGPGAVC